MSGLASAGDLRGPFPPAGVDPEDLWHAWRCACRELRLAYAAWSEARPTEAGDAYAVYRAASDREAVAAHVLGGLAGQNSGGARRTGER